MDAKLAKTIDGLRQIIGIAQAGRGPAGLTECGRLAIKVLADIDEPAQCGGSITITKLADAASHRVGIRVEQSAPTGNASTPCNFQRAALAMDRRYKGGQVALWARGHIGQYRFDALVYPQHASSPDYELGRSRIAKLLLMQGGDAVAHFERGWAQQPKSSEAAAAVSALQDGLAKLLFPKVKAQK